MDRRTFLAALAAVSSATPLRAQQPWPDTTVRFIVPYAAGGPTDVSARLVAEAMSRSLPHRVIVENVTGAGTVAGTARVAGAANDGLTLLIATVANSIHEAMYANLPFNPAEAFAPAAMIGIAPMVVLVKNDNPAKTLADLIGLARERGGALTYGSAGIGSSPHLGTELLKTLAKVDMTHVPYRGTGPAATDLMGGRLDMLIDSVAAGIQNVRSGTLRALAVTTLKRVEAFPDVPTVAESYPGYESYTWNAVLAPAGTPPDTIEAINKSVASALADPALAGRLRDLGIIMAETNTPAATKAFIANERAKWLPLLRAAGVKPIVL